MDASKAHLTTSTQNSGVSAPNRRAHFRREPPHRRHEMRSRLGALVAAGAAAVLLLAPETARADSESCAYDICYVACVAEVGAFLDGCLFCDFPEGNCEHVDCLAQFGGCIPEEICNVLHDEMIASTCNEMAQAGCIQGTIDDGFCADADGDGAATDEDCDDGNAEIHPGAIEACDGLDNDCDGDIDEDFTGDADLDGTLDCIDPCPFDNPDDTDFDGVCDSADVCPGGDDAIDGDSDGVADFCDACPLDNPDDTDGDGTCDSDEICPRGDDDLDQDEDGIPDACDPCPADADDSCGGTTGGETDTTGNGSSSSGAPSETTGGPSEPDDDGRSSSGTDQPVDEPVPSSDATSSTGDAADADMPSGSSGCSVSAASAPGRGLAVGLSLLLLGRIRRRR